MKIKALFTLLLGSMLISLTASAHTFDIKNGIPSDWDVQAYNGKADKATIDNETGFAIDIEADGGMPMVYITTDKVELSGDMAMSLRMSLSDDGGNGMRMVVLNEAVPVITVTGTSITVFELAPFEAEADKLFDLDISYKADTKAVRVWYDGILVAEGSTNSYNVENSNVTISSYLMGDSGSSNWFFSKICLMSDKGGELSLYPAENETVTAEAVEAVWADFGVLTGYGTKNGGEVKLYRNGEEEESTILRDEAKVIITPKNGFFEGGKYRVVLTGGSDVFGNSIPDIDYEFSTARSGYEEASVRIISPVSGTKLLKGDKILIESEAVKGSEELVKAELYENGRPIMTDNEAPYSFNYSGDTGTRELKVVVTDGIGGKAESESITLHVLENSAPLVKINGITPMSEVLINNNLTLSVSDTEDNFDYTEAYLDGEKLVKISDTEFRYPDDTVFGKRTLTVYAYDKAGAMSETSVTAYFTRADVEIEVDQNMQTYEAEKSEVKFPGGMFGYVANPGYVCSGEAEGRKAMCLGGSTGGDAYYGVTWQGGTNMPKEQFVCEMDVLFTDKTSIFGSTIRSNEATTRFSSGDFVFENGTLKVVAVGKTVPYELNKWYSLRFEANLSSGTFSFSFDGEVIAENAPLKTAVPDISVLRFYLKPTAGENTKMYLSRFKVEDITAYPYISDAEENRMSLADKSINVSFNKQIGENFTLDKVEFVSNGAYEIAERAEYDKESSSVKAVMKTMPEQSGEYKLLLSGKYMGIPMKTIVDFKAEAGSFDAARTGFTTTDEGVSFWVDMQNDTGEDKTALAVIIKYESGIMTAIESASGTVTADGKRIVTPAVPSGGEEVNIIAVIWNDRINCVPLNNNIYTYNE